VVQRSRLNVRNDRVKIHVLFSILDGSSAPVTCSCGTTKRVSQGLEHGLNSYASEMVFFVSMRIKKNQNFLSADHTLIPGVNQVFPVLEWNLIFVLLSKILDRLKRLFVVQIPRVTVYREMRNIYV